MDTTQDTPASKPHQVLVDFVSNTYYEGGKKDEIRAKITSDPKAFDTMLGEVYESAYADSGLDFDAFKTKYVAKNGNPFEVKKKDASAEGLPTPSGQPAAPSGASGDEFKFSYDEILPDGTRLKDSPNLLPEVEVNQEPAPEGQFNTMGDLLPQGMQDAPRGTIAAKGYYPTPEDPASESRDQMINPNAPAYLSWGTLEDKFKHLAAATPPPKPKRKAGEKDDVSWGRAAVGKFNRSFYEVAPAALESIAMGFKFVDDIIADGATLAHDLAPGDFTAGFKANAVARNAQEVKDFAVYQAGVQLRDWFAELNPMQADQENRFDMQVVGGLAQGLQMIMAAPANVNKLGLISPELAATGKLAQIQKAAYEASQQMYSRAALMPSVTIAASEFRDAKDKGASDETAMGVAAFNAVISSGLETLGPMLMLKRLDKLTGGGFKRVLRESTVSGAEEAMTEITQQWVSNLTARNAYDETRKLTAGITESGSVGGATGFALNILMAAIGGRMRAAKSPQEISQLRRAQEYLQQQINLQQREHAIAVQQTAGTGVFQASTRSVELAATPSQSLDDKATTIALADAVHLAQAQVATAPTTEMRVEQAAVAADDIISKMPGIDQILEGIGERPAVNAVPETQPLENIEQLPPPAPGTETVLAGGKVDAYGDPMPQREVAKPTGITPDRVEITNLQDLLDNNVARLEIAVDGQAVAFEQFDVTIDRGSNTAEVAFVRKKDRAANRGVGLASYIKLGQDLAAQGIQLVSEGQAQLPGGKQVWDQMIAQGLAERTGAGRYAFKMTSDPAIIDVTDDAPEPLPVSETAAPVSKTDTDPKKAPLKTETKPDGSVVIRSQEHKTVAVTATKKGKSWEVKVPGIKKPVVVKTKSEAVKVAKEHAARLDQQERVNQESYAQNRTRLEQSNPHPVTVGKQSYLVTRGADGAVELYYESGEPVNRKSKHYATAVNTYKQERLTDFIQGKEANLDGVQTPAQYVSAVLESENPAELAVAWESEPDAELDYKTQMIQEHLRSTTQESYRRNGDINEQEGQGQIRLNYIRPDGMTLDVQAEAISEIAGVPVTEGDLIDFINAYPNGQQTARPVNQTKDKIAQRFFQLTGFEIDPDYATQLRKAYLPDGDLVDAYLAGDPDLLEKLYQNELFDAQDNVNERAAIDMILANPDLFPESTYTLDDQTITDLLHGQTTQTTPQPEQESPARAKTDPQPAAVPEQTKTDRKEAAKARIKENLKALGKEFMDSLTDTSLSIATLPEQRARELYETHKKLVQIASDALTVGQITVEEFADALGTSLNNLIRGAYNSAAGKVKGDTFEDFQRLHNIALERKLVDSNQLTPTVSEDDPAAKRMKIVDRVLASDRVGTRIKQALQKQATGYIPRGLEISKEDAEGLISAMGPEAAELSVRDVNNGLTGDTRVAVAAALFELYQGKAAAKGVDQKTRHFYRTKMAEITIFASRLTNSAGRTVNSAKLFKQILGASPEAAAIAVEKEITERQEKVLQPIQQEVAEAHAEVKKTFEETVAEAVAEVLGKGFTPKPRPAPGKTNARDKIKDFFERLKIKDTSPKGKLLDASSALYYLGAKVYNAGLDVVQKAIIKGWDVAQAVAAGADVIDRLQNGESWARQDFVNDMTQQLGSVVGQIKQEADVESVADQVARRTLQYVSDSETKKDAVMMAINSLMGKVRDKVKQGERTPITDLEKLTFAIENRRELQQEWEEAMDLLVDRIEENDNLTDDEKADLFNRINDAVYDNDPRMHAQSIGRRLVKQHLKDKTALQGPELARALDEMALGITDDGLQAWERSKLIAREMVRLFGMQGDTADAMALSLSRAYNEEMRARQQRLQQRPEVVARKELDQYYGKEEVQKRLTELAKAHYSEPMETRDNLADRILEDDSLFFSQDEAYDMADAIEAGFDAILQKKKDSILESLDKRLATPKVSGKKKKTLLDKALELANLGALDSRWNDLYAEAMGIKPLSTEDRRRIYALSDKIQQSYAAEKEYVSNPTPDTKRDYEEALHDAEIATVQLQEYLMQERSMADMMITLIQGNTLTLGTQSVNLAGNVTQQAAVRFPVHVGAAALDFLISAATRTPRSVLLPSQSAYIKGMVAGHKKGARELKTGAIDAGNLERASALHPFRAMVRLWRGESSSVTKDLLEAIPGMTAEGTFRMLNYTDRVAKGGAAAARLREIGKLKGLEGEALERFELAPDEDSRAEAEKAGLEATFQESGKWSKAAQDAYNGFLQKLESKSGDMNIPFIGSMAKILIKMPALYIRVPLNIFAYSWGQAMFPLRLVEGVSLLRKGKRREAAFQLSHGIYGAATMSLALALVKAGIMTAVGEKDDEARERQAGYTHHPQGGFNVTAFNRWTTGRDATPKPDDRVISYATLGQLGMTMGIWAAVFSSDAEGKAAAAESKEDSTWSDIVDYSSQMFGALPKMGATVLEQPWAKSMADLLEGLRGGNAGDRLVSNYIATMANAFYPASVSAVSRASSDYIPDKKADDWEGMLKNEFKIRTFQSADLPATVNMWGERARRTDLGVHPYFALVDPLKSKFLDTEHFGYKIYQLYKETGNVTYLPSAPERTLRYEGEEYKLTPAQYERFATLVGRDRAVMVRELVESADWLTMTKEEKLEELKELYTEGLEYGKEEMVYELDIL